MNPTAILSSNEFRVSPASVAPPPTSWQNFLVANSDVADEYRKALGALSDFAQMPTGWDAGRGFAITHEAISAGKVVLNTFAAIGSVPDVSPLSSGGVLFEITLDGHDVAVDISASGTCRIFVLLDGREIESPASPAGAVSAMIENLFSRSFTIR